MGQLQWNRKARLGAESLYQINSGVKLRSLLTNDKPFRGIRVVALIATHNRVELTLECLRNLFLAAALVEIELEVFLVDAGSSDRTVSRVQAEFPHVHTFSVDSNKYWAESMRIAWEKSKTATRDYIMWLNDDVSLHTTVFEDFLTFFSKMGSKVIACGITQERETGVANYGGHRLGPWHSRLRLSRSEPRGQWAPVDLANGNILFVPDSVDESLGGFPKGFRHGMADFYYTASARKKGIEIFQSPEAVGVCETNRSKSDWEDHLAPLGLRLVDLGHPKNFPLIPWLRFSFRIGGLVGPLYAIHPLIRVLTSWAGGKLQKIRALKKHVRES